MNMKVIIGGALALALGLALKSAGAELVSSPEAHALVAGGAALVDVRTSEEFADGHIEGAMNIPVDELSKRLAEVGPKSRPVVVYCQSGGRSRAAAQTLRDAGFTQVRDLGAMKRWRESK